MREILNLAAILIEASGSSQRTASVAHAKLVVVAAAIAALGALGTVICLLTALWLYEAPILGEVGAPLVVAAVLAAATLIAVLVLHAKTTVPPPAPNPLATGAALHGGLQALMRSHKSLILIGALVAGLAAGESERR